MPSSSAKLFEVVDGHPVIGFRDRHKLTRLELCERNGHLVKIIISSMKNVLFNGHDIVLALVIVFSFLLVVRTVSNRTVPRETRPLLTAFFLLNAFVAMDTLLFWGNAIRYAAFDLSPWLLMFFSFAPFAIGPTLYWVVRSWAAPGSAWKSIDFLHLLPTLITPIYLYWACFRFPLEQQRVLILDLAIFSDVGSHFLTFLTLKKLLPVIYGILCTTLIYRMSPSVLRQANAAPVIHLYAGFIVVWLWVLVTHTLGQWLPVVYSDSMGIFGNYLSLTLVGALFFLGILFAPLTLDAHEGTEQPPKAETDDLAVLAERVRKFVLEEKPYLNPQLTLERFAALVDVSPRQVSLVVNRCFGQNFHEYINRFRIEEAKRLLHAAELQENTILEIAQRAGFNSKATFNRFFKALVGVTPSAYRQQLPELITAADLS